MTELKNQKIADEMNRLIAGADLALSGKIKSLRPLEKQPVEISEHNPDWIVMEMEITGKLKGEAPATIRVLYPGNNDVAFRNYPKPDSGKEWFVILHKSRLLEGAYEVQTDRAVLSSERYAKLKDLLKK